MILTIQIVTLFCLITKKLVFLTINLFVLTNKITIIRPYSFNDRLMAVFIKANSCKPKNFISSRRFNTLFVKNLAFFYYFRINPQKF
jgi:hypothetical protein